MITWKTPKGTRYQFERHAEDRMLERRITQLDVERVIDDFHTSYRDKKGNVCLVGYLKDGRRLRIVVDDARSPIRVVTVIILG
ncbi:MAG: DUF4258 domain-containing protein [Chloroflexota bacterium]